jgi:intein-encoded DNA endonuclease-like protein
MSLAAENPIIIKMSGYNPPTNKIKGYGVYPLLIRFLFEKSPIIENNTKYYMKISVKTI